MKEFTELSDQAKDRVICHILIDTMPEQFVEETLTFLREICQCQTENLNVYASPEVKRLRATIGRVSERPAFQIDIEED